MRFIVWNLVVTSGDLLYIAPISNHETPNARLYFAYSMDPNFFKLGYQMSTEVDSEAQFIRFV